MLRNGADQHKGRFAGNRRRREEEEHTRARGCRSTADTRMCARRRRRRPTGTRVRAWLAGTIDEDDVDERRSAGR
jgi:hypothetical protein